MNAATTKTINLCLTEESREACKTNLIVLPFLLASAKTITIVLPIVWCCLQDNVCGFPDNLGLSDRMKPPRQSLIVWPNEDQQDNPWLSDRMKISKTILDCLTEWRLSDRALNCLASYKIVFLLCLVLARQSKIVLPFPLCLCYLQLSCLSIVLQVQMLCL